MNAAKELAWSIVGADGAMRDRLARQRPFDFTHNQATLERLCTPENLVLLARALLNDPALKREE